MAYQNVGTPRFYIDQINYQKEIGSLEVINEWDVEVSGLNYPSHFKKIDLPQTGGQYKTSNYSILNKDLKDINWVGIIGHTIGDELKWQIEGYNGTFSSGFNNKQGIINWEGGSVIKGFSIIGNSSGDYFNFDEDVEYLRFTLMTSSGNSFLDDNITEVDIGNLCFGRYYDMPVSPDLDLSMTVEFDGYDNTTTLGGSTLTNVRYTGSPWWYDANGNKVEPWSIGTSPGTSKRNGRRMWSMKFNYISDKNLFASNYMSNTYLETSTNYESNDLTTDNNNFEYTLENDNSFIAQVLNKVGNGQRFIFQPDNTNNNPDQFAICQLDQDSLQIKQVAFNTYSISLNIREVW